MIITNPMMFGGAAGNPYISDVKLLMHMDGANDGATFIDMTGKYVSKSGNTVTKTATKKYGTASAYFDGGGGYLSIADHADWDFGAGAFTIEAWVNIAVYQTYFPVVAQWNANSSGGFAWALYGSGSGIFRIGVRIGGVEYGATAASGVALNTWAHVAAVRSGSVLSLYLDGVLTASTSIGAGSLDTSSSVVRIGELIGSTGNGYIDDLRITKGVARYTANFTPPTESHPDPVIDPNDDLYFDYVSLLMHMDGSNDGTSFTEVKGKSVTRFGNTVTKTDTKKYGTASAYFDGTTDYLSIADSPDFSFGAGEVTIEWWSNISTSSAYDAFVAQATATTLWKIDCGATGLKIRFTATTSSVVVAEYLTTSNVITTGTWQHFAVVRSGSSVYIFVDGVSAALTVNTAISTTSLPDVAAALIIGQDPINSGRDINGYIDDLRITKGVARYTANFTPPTTPHPDF